MLGNSQVVAVVAVTDMARARDFYEGTLGLQKGEMDDPAGVLYVCGGGSQVLVYQSQYAGTNEATAASWQVEDLDGEIDTLKTKGVTFEEYDMPGVAREGAVHSIGGMRAAWFKDPDGNILNLSSRS